VKCIGVVGAGTMGAGIAQVVAQAGFDVLLYDIGPGPLEAGLERIRSSLTRQVERTRMTGEARDGALARITTTSDLAAFSQVDFVIEAAPEALELKRKVFTDLDRHCRPDVILATNTSSLSVTEIAAFTDRQDLVVGMHFFNPVPQMRLVEVVTGARTGAPALEQTTELARTLGKRPVHAKDTPGFLVNRIARPFPGEALRLLAENVAGIAQIDRTARLAAGFRMGPFELMDLVGMDVNFAVNKSVFEQYFYEPRFRPHPLQAQMVKANLLGRKTGQGWYRYESGQIVAGPTGAVFTEQAGARVTGIESVCVVGDDDLAALVAQAGYRLTTLSHEADLLVLSDPQTIDEHACREGAIMLVEASRAPLTQLAAQTPHPEAVVGYGGIPSITRRQLIEVAVGLRTAQSAWQNATRFFQSLGRETEVIHDGPGLIAPRLIACLVNEAAYALMEGIASADDIDTAMKLGVNYPLGPLEWADQIGPGLILWVLEELHATTGDPRYRPCPYLRKLVEAGRKFADLTH
jgi:3-hydroxybutyryl-CoA dehydrogenase